MNFVYLNFSYHWLHFQLIPQCSWSTVKSPCDIFKPFTMPADIPLRNKALPLPWQLEYLCGWTHSKPLSHMIPWLSFTLISHIHRQTLDQLWDQDLNPELQNPTLWVHVPFQSFSWSTQQLFFDLGQVSFSLSSPCYFSSLQQSLPFVHASKNQPSIALNLTV